MQQIEPNFVDVEAKHRPLYRYDLLLPSLALAFRRLAIFAGVRSSISYSSGNEVSQNECTAVRSGNKVSWDNRTAVRS